MLCGTIMKSTNVKWLCLNRFMHMENQFDYVADGTFCRFCGLSFNTEVPTHNCMKVGWIINRTLD